MEANESLSESYKSPLAGSGHISSFGMSEICSQTGGGTAEPEPEPFITKGTNTSEELGPLSREAVKEWICLDDKGSLMEEFSPISKK